MVTLDDVAAPVPNAIVDGPFGSNLKLDDYVPEGVPVLQGKNITDDAFRWFDVRFISSRKARELRRSSVRIGDILIVKIGSIGYSAILDDLNGFDHAVIPANLAKVTPDLTKVDLRYLHKWLTSTAAKDFLVRAASKTAQPALSLGKIKGLPVPLPPLPEQRWIAAILDKADALRTKRRAALAQLDTLTQSIFLDMFGDPATNPKTWPVIPLESKCVIAGEYGANVASTDFEPDLPRYVRITDVTEAGELNDQPVSPAGSRADWAPYELAAGDLLFARSGATVGKTYMHRASNGRCVFAGYMIRFRPDSRELLPEYVFAFTRTAAYREWVAVRQRVVAQPNINARQYGRELLIPLPPVELQREFIGRFAGIGAQASAQREARSRTNELFAALQHRAFRGEL
jgi:type I restriction enzyme S subunit